ncbi:MAG: DUF3300 domain-containing protein [Verrucomicrobiota bacterium]|jgi:hypothetical protein
MKLLFKIAVLLCVLTGTALSLRAQMAVPPPTPAYQPLAPAQLDQLLGPIALYPDPLIAQILPASTLPTQIVLADRYVSGGGDPNQINQQPWDPSVQALARYPNVLKWMDDNLNWTTDLGQAFLNQQQDVMVSIQRLRTSAYNIGNLQSTPQQQVVNDGGYIEIVPAEPQVIYVPVYQPDQVYYQTCYGPPFITFGIGWPIGLWLNCDFDWGHHNIIVWGRDHPRPPNWWHEPPHQRNTGHTTVWRRDNHPGAVAVNRGDRGYGIPHNQPVVAAVGRSVSDSAAPRRTPAPATRPEAPATRASMPVARPAPAAVERSQPISRPESNGAFIGIQSSHDTRTYSDRGQQSMQAITHSEPVSRSAPEMSSGGGGGGHSSNSQPRH